jgi:hypothetical protein
MSIGFFRSRRSIMHRHCLAPTLGWLLFVGASCCSAQAFLGAPYLTPTNPTQSDVITVNIDGDGCEALDAGVIYPPPITREGNALQVMFTGGYWTDPFDCLLTPGIQTYPLFSYPPGSYTLNIIWRYPGMSGAIEQQDLGTLPFTVSGVAPPVAISAPAMSYLGLCALVLTLAIAATRSQRKGPARDLS